LTKADLAGVARGLKKVYALPSDTAFDDLLGRLDEADMRPSKFKSSDPG
jgi:hypothetical protein